MPPNPTNVLHQGNLPVRVLAYSIIQYFQTTHLNFIDELEDEMQYNGLQSRIIYDNGEKAIDNLASISEDGIISLNEPYLAYLWCLSYAVIALKHAHDYGNSTPELTPELIRAFQSLNYGCSLFSQWSSWDVNIPNPEFCDTTVDSYIGEANGVMLLATRFILCHEYSHHYLGHTFDVTSIPKDELKKEEFAADKHAFEIMMQGMGETGPQMDATIQLGIVIGICSLFFINGCWKGGDEHPDIDERVYRLLEMLDNNPNSNCWEYGLLMLFLWNVKFNGVNTDPSGHESSKDDYLFLANHLKSGQNC